MPGKPSPSASLQPWFKLLGVLLLSLREKDWGCWLSNALTFVLLWSQSWRREASNQREVGRNSHLHH